jgi:multidrug efflux pump subunit AcrA (membrane-fusion protein)
MTQSDRRQDWMYATGVVDAGVCVSVISPKVEGSLRLIRLVENGARVGPGDFLMEFDGSAIARRLGDLAALFQNHQEMVAQQALRTGHPDGATDRDSMPGREIQLKKEMRALLNALDMLTVQASAAGVVLHKHPALAPGMMVDSPGPILEIQNRNGVHIRIPIDDAASGKFLVGQRCVVQPPEPDGLAFDGEIVELRSGKPHAPGQALDNPMEAWIALDSGADLSRFAPGSRVQVRIEPRRFLERKAVQAVKHFPLGKSPWVRRAAVALLLVAAATAVASYRHEIVTRISQAFGAGEEDPIPVLSLEKSSIVLEIQANGEIVGMESVPVPTPVTRAGSLKLAWLVPEGSMVEKGESIVQFDATNLNLSLEQQTNTLTQNLENTKITTGNQQLSEKALSIDRTQAQMDYDYSMTVMPNDETIFSRWAIIEAQVNANLARSRIDNLATKAQVTKRMSRSQQQVLSIDRSRMQAEIEIINESLNAMELGAPASGLVMYRRERRRDPQIGDSYQPRKVIADIVDLNALQARIYVLEKEAGSLAKGKTVVLRLDALPGKELRGEVKSVSNVAATLERNSPVKYFTCSVVLHDTAAHLRYIKPGMELRARIILEKYDSCYVVPAGAVSTKGQENVVYVKQGQSFQPRSVTLGLGKHGQTTILSGVSPGEVIALRNPFETPKLSLPDFGKGYLKRRKEP